MLEFSALPSILRGREKPWGWLGHAPDEGYRNPNDGVQSLLVVEVTGACLPLAVQEQKFWT